MLNIKLLIALYFIANIAMAQNKSNAGILPYCYHNGGVLVLLGRDSVEYPEEPKETFWTDFTGQHNPEDRNNKLRTAFREFMEETRGVFDSCCILKNLIKAEEIKLLNSSRNTYRYIIEVHHISVDTILSKPFKKKGQGDTEKKEYCWVNLSDLLKVVDSSYDRLNTKILGECF